MCRKGGGRFGFDGHGDNGSGKGKGERDCPGKKIEGK